MIPVIFVEHLHITIISPQGIIRHLLHRDLDFLIVILHCLVSSNDQLEEGGWKVFVLNSVAAENVDVCKKAAQTTVFRRVEECEVDCKRSRWECLLYVAEAPYFVDDHVCRDGILETVGNDVQLHQISIAKEGSVVVLNPERFVVEAFFVPFIESPDYVVIDAVQVVVEDVWVIVFQLCRLGVVVGPGRAKESRASHESITVHDEGGLVEFGPEEHLEGSGEVGSTRC
jgi:hypothetical protein